MTNDNPLSSYHETSGKKRVILKNGLILTHPGTSRVEPHKFTVFDDNFLISVNSGETYPTDSDEIIDCSGCLIMPGLVNCHCHTPMSLLRGLADDSPLHEWLTEYIFPVEARFVSPDFVYTGAMLSMVEMILSGTTTVADAYFFMESAAEAAIESGMRAVLAQGAMDIETPDASGSNDWENRVNRFLDNFPHSKITKPALFCHSPYLCSERAFVRAHEIALEHDMILFSHVSETLQEVQNSLDQHTLRPFERLARMGVLDRNFVAVHSVHVNDEERSMLSESGAGIVHCPRSNMKLSSGMAHVKKLADRGINLGIGTDGPASNNNLDLFEEMRSAALISKIAGSEKDALSVNETLFFVTQGGARVLNMENVIGSLEPGKYADLIVVDLNAPHMNPPYCRESFLVYSGRGSDVRHVFVHGKQVVRDRKITTIDMEVLMDKVRRFSGDISRNTGVSFWGKQ